MILRVSPDEGCSEDKKLNKKKESSEIIRTFFLLVDLEGIEPSSKRGNHKLSTCLSLPNFSCNGRTKAINHYLILLIFTKSARPL